MDSTRRTQLIKRRAVAKTSLTRMQNFLESGDLKVNEIKVRLINYRVSLINMILHRMSWNCTMTQTTLMVENYLRNNTLRLRQNSMSFFILWLNSHCLDAAHLVAVYQDTATNRHGHMWAAHTLSYQLLHCRLSKVTHAAGYTTETLLRH